MKVVGYHLTWWIDRGDDWLNAVEPYRMSGVAHRECAWNTGDLSSIDGEVEELTRISYEEAEQRGLVCCYCEQPLTIPQRYDFQNERTNEQRGA